MFYWLVDWYHQKYFTKASWIKGSLLTVCIRSICFLDVSEKILAQGFDFIFSVLMLKSW